MQSGLVQCFPVALNLPIVIVSQFSFLRRICGSYAAFVVLVVAMAVPLSAQIDGTPDFAPFLLDKRVEREDYNFRFGPVRRPIHIRQLDRHCYPLLRHDASQGCVPRPPR